MTPASAKAGFAFDYRLLPGCCNDELNGTHASIKTPSSTITNLGNQCILFRSDVEGHRTGDLVDTRLIQTGFVRCSSGTSLDNGQCAVDYRQVQFVEILDELHGLACYSQGSIGNSVDVLYGVRQATDTNVWSAWINGVQFSAHTVAFANTDYMVEGGEYTGTCTDAANTTVPAVTYASSTWWHRLSSSWNWITVGVGEWTQTTYCGFSLNNAPPGPWTITR